MPEFFRQTKVYSQQICRCGALLTGPSLLLSLLNIGNVSGGDHSDFTACPKQPYLICSYERSNKDESFSYLRILASDPGAADLLNIHNMVTIVFKIHDFKMELFNTFASSPTSLFYMYLPSLVLHINKYITRIVCSLSTYYRIYRS